jgi:peptidoglycan-associated lipoprotein
MVKRISIAVVLSTALACASSGSAPKQEGTVTPPSDFPKSTRSDPGLSTGESATSGAAKAMGALRTVYFDFDRYNLTPAAKQDLQHNAQIIRQSGSRVQIQGNCDERGTEEYNLALGMKRADTSKRYLVDLGVPASQLETISFGEERPAVRGTGEAVWAKNRRSDFVAR